MITTVKRGTVLMPAKLQETGMNLKVNEQISGAAKDAPHDAASGMIIELDGAVLEQIAGGETGNELKNQTWAI